ncbi:antitoxin PaaA2 family protein [Methylibium petroleiphilum]
MSHRNTSQAELMRTGHQTANHQRWLAAEIQDALDDPRPSLSFEEAMAAIDAEIDAVERESAIDPAQAEQLFPSRSPCRQ